jgi:hypothetical protein
MIFTDCTAAPTPVASVVIEIEEAVFDFMETCTYDEYKSDDRPSRCDYQQALCTYEGDTHACEVRRKGSSTWKALRDNPSFKVKDLADEVTFGSSACGNGSVVACPLGQTANVWRSDKFTLNNNGFPTFYTKHGEVDAYRVFRDIGKLAVPSAQYVAVTLKRGNATMRTDTYAMIETIDDHDFLEKWYGLPYALWEVEHDVAEYERGKDAAGDKLKDADDFQRPVGFSPVNMKREFLNTTDMIRYYIGEQLTGHWDGACQRYKKHNFYVAAHNSSTDITLESMWSIIPSGVDQSFQGCNDVLSSTSGAPTCEFMKECFADSACADIYNAELRLAKGRARRTVPSCAEELLPVWFALLGVASWLVVVWCALRSVRFIRVSWE